MASSPFTGSPVDRCSVAESGDDYEDCTKLGLKTVCISIGQLDLFTPPWLAGSIRSKVVALVWPRKETAGSR